MGNLHGVPASTSGPPTWVLLDTLGYVADRDNATRADALTTTGQPIGFSFFRAEPPGLSHFCVHRDVAGYSISADPCVVHSTENLALLTICLKHGRDHHREYFLYRAPRRGQPQSLEPLPGLHDHLCKANLAPHASIAVVPCGDDGQHFVLASIGTLYTSAPYNFHVFRSNLRTWTEKVVGAATAMCPEKVIVLRGGEIGWVDLCRCILVCNLLDDDPVCRVIPLPTLLPENQFRDVACVDQFRDVACVDGVIKLVEIEYCRRRIVHDVSKLEVLYDQDLPLGRAVEPEDTYEYTGWRLVTWTREVSSNCWRRGSLLHVDDIAITVDDVKHSALLPGPGLVEKNTRKNLIPGYLILSMDGTDVVYLKCKVEPEDKKAWVVAVDMRNKTILDVAPFPDERFSTNQNYITCALFKYLNAE